MSRKHNKAGEYKIANEIFIPAKYGYGSMRLDDIPAWSTLCFTLTLEKIQQ